MNEVKNNSSVIYIKKEELTKQDCPTDILCVIMKFLENMNDIYSVYRVNKHWQSTTITFQKTVYGLIQQIVKNCIVKLDNQLYSNQIQELSTISCTNKVVNINNLKQMKWCTNELQLNFLYALENIDDEKLKEFKNIFESMPPNFFLKPSLMSEFKNSLLNGLGNVKLKNLSVLEKNICNSWLKTTKYFDFVRIFKLAENKYPNFAKYLLTVFTLVDKNEIQAAMDFLIEKKAIHGFPFYMLNVFVIGKIVLEKDGIVLSTKYIRNLSCDYLRKKRICFQVVKKLCHQNPKVALQFIKEMPINNYDKLDIFNKFESFFENEPQKEVKALKKNLENELKVEAFSRMHFGIQKKKPKENCIIS